MDPYCELLLINALNIWIKNNAPRQYTTAYWFGNNADLCSILGSHTGGYEELFLLGYNAVPFVGNQLKFPREMSPPSSESKNKPGKKREWSKQSFTLVSCLAYSSTLKMGAECSSETSVDFQWIIRRYIPEYRTRQCGPNAAMSLRLQSM
jgi:hypothetical protein